jgi:hypothetical protein
MTEAVSPEIAQASPRLEGRVAGLFWLLTAVFGMFSMSTRGKFVVPGDAAATAANLLAQESLYRTGVAADLVATVCYLVATLLVYDLLRPVSKTISLLAAFFSAAGCATGIISLVFSLSPFVVLRKAPLLGTANAEQLQSVFLGIGTQAHIVTFVFFGLHCLLVGVLILRSKLLPRWIGALMVFAGVSWMTYSLANLLAPSFGRLLFPYILIPGAVGEMSLTLWLLLVSVKVEEKSS